MRHHCVQLYTTNPNASSVCVVIYSKPKCVIIVCSYIQQAQMCHHCILILSPNQMCHHLEQIYTANPNVSSLYTYISTTPNVSSLCAVIYSKPKCVISVCSYIQQAQMSHHCVQIYTSNSLCAVIYIKPKRFISVCNLKSKPECFTAVQS